MSQREPRRRRTGPHADWDPASPGPCRSRGCRAAAAWTFLPIVFPKDHNAWRRIQRSDGSEDGVPTWAILSQHAATHTDSPTAPSHRWETLRLLPEDGDNTTRPHDGHTDRRPRGYSRHATTTALFFSERVFVRQNTHTLNGVPKQRGDCVPHGTHHLPPPSTEPRDIPRETRVSGRCRTPIGSRNGAEHAKQRTALDHQQGTAPDSKA